MKILVINEFHNVSEWQFIRGEMDNGKFKRIDKKCCKLTDCQCITNVYTYLDNVEETEYKWNEASTQWDQKYL